MISLTDPRSQRNNFLVAYSRSPQVFMALPTQGRVLLDTTAGDIDIELWSKVRDVTNNVRFACNKFNVRRKHRKHAGIS